MKMRIRNLYDDIVNEMNEDGTNTDYISAKLIKDYNNSARPKQRIIDDVFITLTGWTLNTLIKSYDVKD